mmetsp:Transcript_263/g.448  ORF Transcript_263/g.448 Transcript_263/m.448 type:complete len:180 (+) Transcript_263:949-1488(+)
MTSKGLSNVVMRLHRRGFLTEVRRALSSTSASAGGTVGSDSDPDFQPELKAGRVPRLDEGDDIGKGVQERIRKSLESDRVVLFMKGLPSSPQCGFSLRTVQILNAMDVPYRAYNVLTSEELRQGIKEYSSWPTIPQLYVDGEFVGGCDIVTDMFMKGELEKLVKKDSASSESAPVDIEH